MMQVPEELSANTETYNQNTNMTAGESCATLSDVKSSGDEEAQQNLSTDGDGAHSGITQQSTAVKSEQLKESEDVGEESAYHSEQLLGEETKAEKQKDCLVQIEANSEDLLDEEEQKTGEVPEEPSANTETYNQNTNMTAGESCATLSDVKSSGDEEAQQNEKQRRRRGTEQSTAMASWRSKREHSEEDEEEVRRKETKEDFSHQTGGEEADVESVKKDTSAGATSQNTNMTAGESCATLNDVKSSGDEEAQQNLPTDGDGAHSGITQQSTAIKSSLRSRKKVKESEGWRRVGVVYHSEQLLGEETKAEKQKGTKKKKSNFSFILILILSFLPLLQSVLYKLKANSEDLLDEEEQETGEVPEELSANTETYKAAYPLMHRATDSKTPCETNSEGPADIALPKRSETNNLVEPRRDEVERKEHEGEQNADNSKKRQREHSEEDEEEREHSNEDFSHQTGGEEADVESVKKDTSAGATSQNTNMTAEKRLHGLYNQGATCYLNSILQILFMTPEIHDRLETAIDRELRKIFEGLKEKKCGTEKITEALGIKDVFQQRDAAEYLEMILNKISSQASEDFKVYLKYTTKCSEGHIISEETNDYWTVQLSLIDNPHTAYSVEKSFERIFETKSYSGDNKVHCNDCNNKTEATSRCEMVKSPQILTLLLKRFDFNYYTMSHFKSNCCVDVPLTLQIKARRSDPYNETYKLYGMVDHSGSLHSGHYTATILPSEDETWYKFNDTSVYKVSEQLFAKTGSHKSSAVYLLMYRATKPQTPCERQKKSETNNLVEPRRDEVEWEEHEGERNADNSKKRKREHSEENEEEVRRKETKEDFSHQTGGEEADVESVKKDTSAGATSQNTNMTAGESCATLSDVKSSGDEEAQQNLPTDGDGAHSGITQQSTAVESEELKESEDVGEGEREHSEEDEEEVRRKETKEDFSHQTGGEEADVESVKKDTSAGATSQNTNMTAGESCATLSDVKSSGDEEAQQNLPTDGDGADSGITQQSTAVESEQQKESEGVGEESAYHGEQLLGEETTAEKQKECFVQIEANSEDEEGDETGEREHSEEDEEEVRRKETKEDFSHQTGGEEADVESVKKDTSAGATSQNTNMTAGESCATLSDVKSSGNEEAQQNLPTDGDGAHSGITQQSTAVESEELKGK
ncbi:hypothetical protein L3Q82_016833 [Scortum barcoo]|uniref:Uncharacterized protein n=1 Tax=Scortum barcoo TaxID=214431 RepID=A0ACB8X8N8_9TELE|nr:hypothetical protein L3Q82_016833 [Scortum barcoo]